MKSGLRCSAGSDEPLITSGDSVTVYELANSENIHLTSNSRGVKALDRLIGGIDRLAFLNEYYGKKPLYVEEPDPRRFADLFNAQKFEELFLTYVATNGPLRLFGKDGVLRPGDYTVSSRYQRNPSDQLYRNEQGHDVAKIAGLHSAGNSIQLSEVGKYSETVRSFNLAIRSLLGAHVASNAFLLPSNGNGLDPHYDCVETFLLQIEGQKRWRIFSPPVSLPLKHGPSVRPNRTNLIEGTPLEDVVLSAGQVLYIPRGFVHENNSVGVRSLHVSVMIGAPTWYHALKEMLMHGLDKLALDEPLVRENFPPTFLYNTPKDEETTRTKLKQFAAMLEKNFDFDAPMAIFREQFLEETHAELVDGTGQLLGSITCVTETTELRRRDNVFRNLCVKGNQVILEVQGRPSLEFEMMDGLYEALEFIVQDEPGEFQLSDIPGGLDDKSKQEIAKLAVEFGLLCVGIRP